MCEGEVIVHKVTVFGVARECENSWLGAAASYKPLELRVTRRVEGGRLKVGDDNDNGILSIAYKE